MRATRLAWYCGLWKYLSNWERTTTHIAVWRSILDRAACYRRNYCWYFPALAEFLSLSLSLSLFPYSALGFRLINSLLHVPYLTRDCLIKRNNGPLSYTRGNCRKHVGELIPIVILHRVQVGWCLFGYILINI